MSLARLIALGIRAVLCALIVSSSWTCAGAGETPRRRCAMLFMQLPQSDERELSELINDFDKLDRSVAEARDSSTKAHLMLRRQSLFGEIIDKAEAATSNFDEWLNTVISQFTSGSTYSDRQVVVAFLEVLRAKLTNSTHQQQLPRIEYELLHLRHDIARPKNSRGYPAANLEWKRDLADFAKRFPRDDFSARAMMELAWIGETSGDLSEAKQWYRSISSAFPGVPVGLRAEGAIFRLESRGQVLSLNARDLEGNAFDLAELRGMNVVIHFWKTTVQPSIAELEQFVAIQKRLGRDRVAIVAVNLDRDRKNAEAWVKRTREAVRILYDPAGLEGALAVQLGVIRLPTTFVLGKSGEVLHTCVYMSQKDSAMIESILRQR